MKKDKNVEIRACFRSPKNENQPAGNDIPKKVMFYYKNDES